MTDFPTGLIFFVECSDRIEVINGRYYSRHRKALGLGVA